ncbi:filamentous hemagglutinin N-terminal domain-containing protein, partial [Methylophaga lonarensis]|uniref:two-partner secretion domain-containing protein n=1 Tax=Methylophaga lonarensis TaxID=999151 RepID=UPI003D2E9047
MLALTAIGLTSPSWAQLPTDGTVTAGSGSISQSGGHMVIDQSSHKLAIDWQSFSIGRDNSVTFNQPSSSAVALNRVLGSDVSVIQGAINANGQVFLVNPNGVLFTPTAQVNVGGLVASTLNISNEDFMAGNYSFTGSSSNAVINQGNITAAEGGYVALIAALIENTGSLSAQRGEVLLGAGSKVTLDLGGPVKIQVEQGAIDALIEHGGAIKADGGLVYLTAKAAGELITTVINHTGITEAQTLATGERGEIYLMGDMDYGRIEVAGTLDASAPNGGDGGFIETSAAKVQIQPGLVVTTKAENGQTGEWLIDPNDYTIAASGGDITGAQLGTNLGTTNVTIQSVDGANTSGNGDIFVNDAVTWSSGNILTLNAIRNIEINSSIDASQGSGGKLVLEYGQGAVHNQNNLATYTINSPIKLQAGQNFSTKLGSDGAVFDYKVITGTNADIITALQAINTDATTLAGKYAISGDVDLTGVAWAPIGANTANKFVGSFDGLGHTISNLTINNAALSYQGLFGVVGASSAGNDAKINAHINNLTLDNFSINANGYIGALAGQNSGSLAVSNISVTNATLTANAPNSYLGGLIGSYNGNWTDSNRIQNVSIVADIDGYSFTG